MNFVGKMLVIVIMIFSVIFMGLTTVVFMTAENYKNVSQQAQEKLTKAQGELQAKDQVIAEGKAATDAAKQGLEDEKKRFAGNLAQLEALGKALEEQRKDLELQRQVTQQSMETAQSEAKHRIAEAAEVRDKLRKTQDDANNLQREKTDLNAKISELTKQLATAMGQNNTLREERQNARAIALGEILQSLNQSRQDLRQNPESVLRNLMSKYRTEVAKYNGPQPPPATLEGIVRSVDVRNEKAEITVGSDDGLHIGNELYIYRKNPPEYLGKMKIIAVDPDQAVGEVIGKTYLGKRLKEGDIVSATLPRSN